MPRSWDRDEQVIQAERENTLMNGSMDGAETDLGYLAVFQEVTRMISMVHDPQEVMDLVVSRLPKLLGVDAATVRLLDRGTNLFVIGAARGVSAEYLSRGRIDTEEVMATIIGGRPVAMTDVAQLEGREEYRSFQREGIVSVLSLPILYQGEVIGLLRLLTKTRRVFREPEISYAMSLAEQIGIAISNGRMYREMQDQVVYLEEVRKISRLVNSTLDLDRINRSIVETLPRLLGVKACTLRLLHPATNRLELVAATGLSEAYLGRGSVSREDSVFKVLKGEPVAIYDATVDSRVNYHQEIRREGIKSILAIPVLNEREVIGVLRLLTDEHRLFTPGEINFVMAVAEESGNAIQKARTYRKIELLFNQIEEHERFLQTIMDSLWLQLVVLSPDKRLIMANRMFLESQNLTENEILGRSYYEVSPWASEDRADCPVNSVLAGKNPVAVVDQLGTGSSRVWVERHLTPIIGDDGDVESVLEAVRDITDQKLLEQEKLEKVKLAGIIEMAGTAAHKINSPLFAALGTAQLLADDLERPQDRHELELIIKNLKEIGDLTREMTTVTGFKSETYVGTARIVTLHSGDA